MFCKMALFNFQSVLVKPTISIFSLNSIICALGIQKIHIDVGMKN